MSFLAPAAFWLLGLLPVIVLFYLLKRRRTVKLVSSTVLWQRFLAESRASAPFQRLRKNWLLLLQLLLLCLVVLALARPFVPAESRPARLRVLLLDNSASMNAVDVKPSRFEQARAQALDWVNNLGRNEELIIVQAGVNTQVRQSATSSKIDLQRALMACTPSDGPTHLAPALRMAESLVRDRADAEIHLFSDGVSAPLTEFENKALPLVYHRVGTGSNNVGITAIDVRQDPADPRKRAVYVSAANFSPRSVRTILELHLDNRLVESRPVTIHSLQTASELFSLEQTRDGIVSAQLKFEDDLPTDNRVHAVSLIPRPVRVLLVTPGNRLLERALRAVPNVILSTAASVGADATGFDVLVVDRVPLQAWPRANVLSFVASDTNWFPQPKRLEAPAIVDWRAGHPLLRHAGFDDVAITETLVTAPPSWAVSLVDAPQASVMLAGELDGRRIVWAGFDILNSNWPLRVSFPIFIANALDWLNPAAEQLSRVALKAGEPFHYPLLNSPDTVVVTTPDGTEEKIPVPENATEFVYGRTTRQGVYHAQLGTNRVPFCVNLLDPLESAIAPRPELELTSRLKIPTTQPLRASLELWRPIAVLALLLLAFEWWYYHRRTA